MDHSNSRLALLFDRYSRDKCSPEERKEFLELVIREENNQEISRLLEVAINESEADRELDPEKAEQLYAAILNEGHRNELAPANVKKLFPFRKLAIAASILIIAGIGLFTILPGKKNQESVQLTKVREPKSDILPGHDNAILTLADGSTIVLDDAKNGALAQQGEIKVIKRDGQISYTNVEDKKEGAPVYNTVSTAKGNQYQLILADGSKVWLNAASSIRFPTAFSDNERKVTINGEAYFEVAHNPKAPFKVTINESSGESGEITVLGTHFNVNAYDDEASIKTTLLEGLVNIEKNNKSRMLSPGQQAQLNNSPSGDGGIKLVNDVDTDEVIAWKNGSFIFNSVDIKSIMRQISRWYDVDVSYKGAISKEAFSGIVSRKSNLSQVLKIMEAGGVRFTIEGRNIIVMNN